MSSKPKIGLALGSGGAKGLAHIGVLKVLEENDIPIDFITGSSMGSVIGSLYAAKQDVEEIETIANETDWQLLFSLLDPSWGEGLIEGEKVSDFIEEHLGDVSFSDLNIPLSVIATDIETGESLSMNKGKVISAVRASISLPLIFKPVEYKDKLLTDGGLSQPVPVEAAGEMDPDLIIAVNLQTNDFDKGKNLNLYRVANRSLDLLRYHLSLANVEEADCVITPEVGNIRWNDFLSSEEAIEEGEQATRDKIAEIKETMDLI
ncbi:MAG: patatin-like phospholipase family protein [Candidatus Paceibacterota bacterium]